MVNQTLKALKDSPDMRAAATVRIERALALIERAQNDLGSACGELSALEGAIPVWKATSAKYDQVKALWYRIHNQRMLGRYRLDETNIEAELRRQGKTREQIAALMGWRQAAPVQCAEPDAWERRVQELEAQGMTRSDAQGAVDVEEMRGGVL